MTEPAPHSKSDIRRLLDSTPFSPNRGRGQNFLIDGNLMRLVVREAELTKDDLVLEVGTGTGSLTRMLAHEAGRVVTVEIDSLLAKIAKGVLEDLDNVTLMHADVLAGKNHVNPRVLGLLEGFSAGLPQIKLVANLPYSIATPVILNLLFGEARFERMVFTVQKEVAERLVAEPGHRNYGWVSVVTSVASETRILRTFPPSAFWPAPKIDSSLVIVRPRPDWTRGLDVDEFRSLGPAIFQQRRKTIARIMRGYLKRIASAVDGSEILASLDIDPKTRGDQLSPEELVRLTGWQKKQLPDRGQT